jgi:TetR/AcrR family transcriptional regulator, transcriptional repressor of bet genes
MPKIGMEPLRRQALIGAAIAEIHSAGSLEITVGNIARRAGVSSALAHHYFGAKDDLIIAVMRHLLRELGHRVSRDLKAARGPRARLSAIIAANFAPEQFSAETVSAWLNFYVKAQRSVAAARLLRVYTRRMRSNLLHVLKSLVSPGEAERIAEGIGALIDGVYLRHALPSTTGTAAGAIGIVEDYVNRQLAGHGRAEP